MNSIRLSPRRRSVSPGRAYAAVAMPVLTSCLAGLLAACAAGSGARTTSGGDGQPALAAGEISSSVGGESAELENRVVSDEPEPEPEPEPQPWPELPPIGAEPPLSVAEPPADAEHISPSMAYKVLAPPAPMPTAADGTELRVRTGDVVKFLYSTWQPDGKVIKIVDARGDPDLLLITSAAGGLQEILKDMGVGERRMYWMPGAQMNETGSEWLEERVVLDVQVQSIEFAQRLPDDMRTPPRDAKHQKSGLSYRLETQGTGRYRADPWDQVSIMYMIWDRDGQLIDGTWTRSARRRPARSYRNPEWTWDLIKTMAVGDKTWVWVPEKLRDPERVRQHPGDIVGVFELLEITSMPRPPKTPRDVAKAPRRARKSPAGVPYRVLRRGTGKTRPVVTDKVKVHYTGWTTDGKMFDSSVVRGQPSVFRLNAVIAGWTDVVQTMKVGQKIRAWIPERLAYKGKPGRPQGVLVFDIELIDIVK